MVHMIICQCRQWGQHSYEIGKDSNAEEIRKENSEKEKYKKNPGKGKQDKEPWKRKTGKNRGNINAENRKN